MYRYVYFLTSLITLIITVSTTCTCSFLNHCRSQWSSGSMSDCSAWGPGISA